MAGCCKVGSKHRAEFEEELDLLDMLETPDAVDVEHDEVVLVETGKVVVVVLEGNAKMMVVETERPVGSADTVGKAKEYRPDGSG